jgi:Zn finger protein HypA/HybF involved in hydrogenase expression
MVKFAMLALVGAAMAFGAAVATASAQDRPIKCWNCDQIVVPVPSPRGPVCPRCGSPKERPKYRY